MRRYLFHFLFFLSGVAGLGYEILWTRMLSVSLGHESVAVLAVMCAFFCGLAIGAWTLGRWVNRFVRPQLLYGFCEVTIGAWALAIILLIPKADPLVASLIGPEPTGMRHWTIAFCYPFLLLLPATIAMGGTLPAMERFFSRWHGSSHSVAGLYSANTFGAMAGTLVTTFHLIPRFGMTKASLFLAMVNFLGAAGVFTLGGKAATVSKPENASFPVAGTMRRYLLLFATGLLGIGFEILMIRSLSQILENTVFSFASTLVAFLFGTALGAAVYQRHAKSNSADFERILIFLLTTTTLCCLASIFLLRYAEQFFQVLKGISGIGLSSAIMAELGLALLFFLLPAAAMGATFSHLAQSLRKTAGGVGLALGLNTLGSALAPFCVGVLLLPTIGLKLALLSVAVGYLLLVPRLNRTMALPVALPLTIALYIAVNPYPYEFLSLADGDTVVYHRQGVMAAVSVVRDKHDQLHLKVDNHFQMGGTTSVFSDWRQALLPLLLYQKPRHALFLGLGTGATVAAAANHPNLQVDGVELVPEVIDAMSYFGKSTGDLRKFPDLHLVAADARRYVHAVDKRYDVVVADLFHPARDGAGGLYTREHFQAIRGLLSEDGIFCQWLPLYQMDLEMFKVIARTFLKVFPDGQAYLAHYSLDSPIIGLIGGRKPLRFPENWYDNRLPTRGMLQMASAFGYDNVYSLLGSFLASPDALAMYAGDGPINTDDLPVVMFQAPRFVYGNSDPPKKRLLELVKTFAPVNPEDIMAKEVTEEDMLARKRLIAYCEARDSFLQVGGDIERTGDVVQLFRTVSQPLLKVVKKSVDFSAAYYPLLSMAYDLYPFDPEASRTLLHNLERANPLRREASILLEKLFVN